MKAKTKPTTPYIVTEAQFLLGCTNPNESDNLIAYAEIAGTYEEARAKMREMMRELVNAEYSEYDDHEIPGGNIDAVLDEIIEGNPDGNEWKWDATNRAAKWRIISPEEA